MFKRGDNVRCVSNVNQPNLVIGQIYTISRIKENGPNLLVELPNETLGFFDFRFELVPPPGEFNVSTATDQELADEYRRLVACKAPIGKALLERGYHFCNNAGTPIKSLSDFTISKTVKTVL